MKVVGVWHITEMEMWDEDYFNMERQAYIQIGQDGLGEFQFGLVSGQIDGEVIETEEGERFEFTWDGSDELDPVSGSGWLRSVGEKVGEGHIKIHMGDASLFKVKKVQ